jgi:hypothetical protein
MPNNDNCWRVEDNLLIQTTRAGRHERLSSRVSTRLVLRYSIAQVGRQAA